jgi:magnesium-protoporphyrin O-methyltransferase
VTFHSGDMLDAGLGTFDHVVCMDSLIHYRAADIVDALGRLADRTSTSIVFTFAPSNPLLATMITVGRLFPQRDRAPFIEPVAERKVRDRIAVAAPLAGWSVDGSERIQSGFYTSQAMRLVRP